MEIFFSEIPPEGLPITGSLPASYFDLKENDSIRVSRPVQFELTLHRFSEAVMLSGEVSGDFELQCVACLEYFPFHAEFGNWQSEVEIEEGVASFDPRESLRDELLLALPHSPHCDELSDRECPRADLLDELEDDAMDTESVGESDEGNNNVWDALDRLKE